MTLVDACGKRLDKSLWLKESECDTHRDKLEDMSLHQFCIHHTVGQRQSHKNKIKVVPDSKKVIMFIPSPSADPSGPNFPQCCKCSLMKYMPWVDSPDTLWGEEEEASDDEIKAKWLSFAKSAGNDLPEKLQFELEAYQRLLNDQQKEQDSFDHAKDDDGVQKEDWQEASDFVGLDFGDDDGMDQVTDVEWFKHYSSLKLSHDYSGINEPVFPEKKVDANYEEEATAATPLDPNVQLNERQELAREMIKDLVARPVGENKTGIVLGVGGTGKTTVVQAVQHDVETGLDYGVGSVGKFATSGVAARLLQGSTAHSSKRGFALPVKQLFKELKGKTLKQLQKRHKDLVLVILDEYSMLKQRELHCINKRLQEIKGNQLPFGGVAFILIGDPGQLPPVQGNVLWCPIASKDDDKAGHLVHQSFHENVMELVEVNRIKGDPDAAKCLEIMMAVRHGNGTKEQWQTVVSNCCQDGMPPHEWNERFGGDDVTYLFTANQEVLNFNLDKLKKLGAPIALES